MSCNNRSEKKKKYILKYLGYGKRLSKQSLLKSIKITPLTLDKYLSELEAEGLIEKSTSRNKNCLGRIVFSLKKGEEKNSIQAEPKVDEVFNESLDKDEHFRNFCKSIVNITGICQLWKQFEELRLKKDSLENEVLKMRGSFITITAENTRLKEEIRMLHSSSCLGGQDILEVLASKFSITKDDVQKFIES